MGRGPEGSLRHRCPPARPGRTGRSPRAPLLVSAILRGVGRAPSSGPAEAWFVDAVHAADGPDTDLTPGLAKGATASSAALGIGVIAGGVLPVVVGDLGGVAALALPVLLGAVFEVVLLVVVVLGLPELPHPRLTVRAVVGGVPATVRTGLRLGLATRSSPGS